MPAAKAKNRPSSAIASPNVAKSPKPLNLLRVSNARPSSSLAIRPQTALSQRTPTNSPRSTRGLSPPLSTDGSNVKVVVRVRPLLPREKGSPLLVQMDPSTQCTTINPPSSKPTGSSDNQAKRNLEPKKFYFDRAFYSVDPNSPHYVDQQEIYNTVGKEFLDHNLEGYHTCIFAYGQTGSGKSYTMMGDDENAGIIPRTCRDLFNRIDSLASENMSCTVRLSYFEIYNECVRDLLATQKKGGSGGANVNNKSAKLKVRESPTDGPYIEDLSEYVVKSSDQVLEYMALGNKCRSTAATKMNDQSSRSHAVFTLTVKQVHFHSDTDTTEEKVSQIRLVDLAGSERANSTGAMGERLREGSNINKSLTTLGRVIAALSVPSSLTNARPIVPYRDSVLTWILKESLGGNSKTAMVACVSPTDYEETLSTLRYADQAKRIQTKAIINQDIVSGADRDKLVEEMQQQINSLQLRQEEDEAFKQELVKVKKAIRFYEDRAIDEENKRRAVQLKYASVVRHNRLLVDYLKEVVNRNGHATVSEANYDTLTNELSSLMGDLQTLKADIASSKENWSSVFCQPKYE
ncbi:tubulin-dependent ATPase KIP3 [Sugiyamaella lignohabitans]|uniref:Kinesin-like protein n=1 Tax=Sugiyamaella lignohabitans TaxID=796027 RepID=A0A167DLI0_9ASCO|nr:tubulin-dependent ATPase KIP3 [Sugiyamaella lignohabitans]ANB13043.1 tubulin-dependent ATPase KIP3 [Sugiyamaella lignohabitans]